jgi:2-dehydro-3-deoxyglucarate aldolase/4-hydroxy-2-oxoheptanedioate aldolase
MSAITHFRQRLAAGETLLGASISFTDPRVSDALADSVDFLWIDLEHSFMSPEALSGHLLAARGRNKPGLVRVTGSSTPFIKPVLDMGADGIIVPQVRSAAEVRQIVSDCRYPPQGTRGFGPRVPSNYGREDSASYIDRANRELFVAVQIENAEALAALDDILAIPGLDSLVIGPWDLSGSLGMLGEVEHPTVVAAIETIIAQSRAAGLAVGAGMGTDATYAARMARRGVQWLQVGGDSGYLVHAIDGITAGIRAEL